MQVGRWILLIILLPCLTSFLHGQTLGGLDSRIDQSIRKGVDYLLRTQNQDGSWGSKPVESLIPHYGDLYDPKDPKAKTDLDGGRTALVALSLLGADVPATSPAITRACELIKSRKAILTYPLAVRCMLFSRLGEPYRERMRSDLRALLEARIVDKPHAGLYSYGPARSANGTSTGAQPDTSNSQYAVLGAWYAALAGAPVSRDFWQSVERSWTDLQQPDGGWAYLAGQQSRMTMTAAGVATLFVTNDYVRSREALQLGESTPNEPLEKGLAWIEKHFTVDHNPGVDSGPLQQPVDANAPRNVTSFQYYMLFGLERVGEASGLTRFGDHEWYSEGAELILQTQRPDGSWKSSLQEPEDTAFALLFLARGRSPVVMQKLKYDGRWNNRPRDASRAVRWMREQMERHVNWQIVRAGAPIDEFMQSPVLYATGDQPIKLSDEQSGTIKQYVDRGGLMLCVNEGARSFFGDSIVELARKWYPNYSFREVPPDHVFYKGNFQVKNLGSPILSLSNGVRELIVLVPQGDLSARWHSAVAAAEVSRESPFLVLGNLVPYANGRTNPRFKTEIQYPQLDASVELERRVHVARIEHSKNWNPEPSAWQRQAIVMNNENRIQLNIVPVKLGIDPLEKKYRLAHMTMTEPIDPPLAEQKALRDYVEAGGVLLVDIAGGSTAIQQSVEDFLSRAFPGSLIKPLPVDHPIYTGAGIGGRKIDPVTYRRFTEERLPRTNIGRLKALAVDNRIAVIYSAEDLTFGMTGALTDGVIGYAPETATDLVRNLILYSLKPQPVAPK